MLHRHGIWIVLILCCGTAIAADASNEQMLAEAKAAYEKGNFEECKDLTTRILQQNPKEHAALYYRASAKIDLGVNKHDVKEIREGIEDSRESLKVGGGGELNYYLPYLHGMISLATIEDKKEHANVALDVAKMVLNRPNITPEQRANVLYQRGAADLFLRDLSSAIEDYQAAIKNFPQLIGAYMQLAQCYESSGQSDKAFETFTTAIQTVPNNHLLYNNRGLFLQKQGRLPEALSDFNKAIELDNQFSIAYANRGFTYQGMGNLTAAEADFTKALSLETANPLFFSLRGSCRLSRGNSSGAIEDFTQAINLNPQNAVAHADLGFAKFFSREYQGAFGEFEKATQIDPVVMRYINPWKVWALVLAGKPDEVDAIAAASSSKPEKDRDWIDEQVLFLKGEGVSEQSLVDFLDKTTDPKLKLFQRCEAYYFIGQRREQSNDKTNATIFYRNVLAMKEASQLSAYRGAQYALNEFGK